MRDLILSQFIRSNRLHREYLAYGERSPYLEPIEVLLFNASHKKKMLEDELILVGMKDELKQSQKRTKSKLYKLAWAIIIQQLIILPLMI